MKSCSICKASIEAENPSILTMGNFGNPRYVCECCDKEMERMLCSKEIGEVQDAMKILGDHLARTGCEDTAVIDTMEKMFSGAAERLDAIREGTYDFAKDEAADEDLVDVPEELQESEEDRILDEKDDERAKKFDKVMNYVWIAFFILFGIAAAYLLIRR